MTSAIVVGSGPNGLAAALTLASKGIEVTVLEATDSLGGGTRTSELTLPGLVHDECSAAHPLAVDTAFSRRFDLGAHGLTWRWPEVQYAHPLDGAAGAAAFQSVDATADALGTDGPRWQSLFGPLAERFHDIATDFMRPMLHVPEHPLELTRFGLYSAPAGGRAGSPLADRGGARCSPASPPMRSVPSARRCPRRLAWPLAPRLTATDGQWPRVGRPRSAAR
jgi:phytoene dehydrogenase-like protein